MLELRCLEQCLVEVILLRIQHCLQIQRTLIMLEDFFVIQSVAFSFFSAVFFVIQSVAFSLLNIW